MFRKKILKVSIVVVLLSFVSFSYLPFAVGEESMIKTGQQALEIAQEYVLEKYQQNFNDYSIIIRLADNIWTVRYVPPMEGSPPLSKVIGNALGGGGLQVEIDKETGIIVFCDWVE